MLLQYLIFATLNGTTYRGQDALDQISTLVLMGGVQNDFQNGETEPLITPGLGGDR